MVLEFWKAKKILHDFVESVVKDHQKPGTNPPQDLITLLLNTTDPDTGRRFNALEVRDEVVTFLFGGYETTTATLGWFFYHMCKNEKAQKLVQEELDKVVGKDRDITYDDLDKLQFLSFCLKESMRISPAAVGFGRRAPCDIVLPGDYYVPKNSILISASLLTHNDTKYWDKPEEFQPERWLNADKINKYQYLPFGAGNRMCAGLRFANLELHLVIASLLRRFSCKFVEGKPVKASSQITRSPRELFLNFTERT